MTIEEAKEVFINRGFVNGLFNGDKWRESVIVISKWLEQEPCKDYVSRDAVLNKKELVELEDGQSFYCISPEDVETLPSVIPKESEDIEPKRGHGVNNICTQKCCLKNHNVGVIECDEKYCSNRTKF